MMQYYFRNNPMSYSGEFGFFGFLGLLTWVLLVVFLILGIMYFWKGINKK